MWPIFPVDDGVVILNVWHSRDDFQKMIDPLSFRRIWKLGCGRQSRSSLRSRRYTLASPKITSILLPRTPVNKGYVSRGDD
jgi:hypothetical protein